MHGLYLLLNQDRKGHESSVPWPKLRTKLKLEYMHVQQVSLGQLTEEGL